MKGPTLVYCAVCGVGYSDKDTACPRGHPAAPTVPYVLTHNDVRLLRSMRIAATTEPEEAVE